MIAEQLDLENQFLPTVTDECTPMDKIKAVLERGTDMYDVLCHTKKQIVEKKGGGRTLDYSGGEGPDEWSCFKCGQLGCQVSKCKKPLNKDVIKKNCNE